MLDKTYVIVLEKMCLGLKCKQATSKDNIPNKKHRIRTETSINQSLQHLEFTESLISKYSELSFNDILHRVKIDKTNKTNSEIYAKQIKQ